MKKIGTLRTYPSAAIETSYISIDFGGLDRRLFTPEKCYAPLGQSGVKYARCQTGWARCEKEKGVYDFAWLDEVVDRLIAEGVRPWFNVSYGNPLYMPDATNPTAVGCVPLYYGEETVAAWQNFVAAVAERYGDRVTEFEIWNEPDMPGFWYPAQPNGADYAAFYNLTAQTIRRVRPSASIGAVTAMLERTFLRAFLTHVKKEYFDFFCRHAYALLPEHAFEADNRELRRELDAAGFSRVEIWQGEGGYPSWAYKGHWLVAEGCDDERPQAVWQLRRVFLDVWCGLKRSSFFQMADMWERPYETADKVLARPAAHGILRAFTYEPKQSYHTLSRLAALFSGDVRPAAGIPVLLDIDAPTPAERLACRALTFEKAGAPLYAYWFPAPLGVEPHIPYRALLRTADPLACPVLIDPYTGDVFDAAPNAASPGDRVYIDLPLTDYPLVLTEREAIGVV